MLAIPELDGPSVAFGDIKHMPKYETLPDAFKRHNGNDFVRAVSTWFFKGAKFEGGQLTIGEMTFVAKPGVDSQKALRAIKAVLGSWDPPHEVKEAACGFMLSEWFEPVKGKPNGK